MLDPHQNFTQTGGLMSKKPQRLHTATQLGTKQYEKGRCAKTRENRNMRRGSDNAKRSARAAWHPIVRVASDGTPYIEVTRIALIRAGVPSEKADAPIMFFALV